MQDDDQDALAHEDHDRERGERPDRVDEVRSSELHGATERRRERTRLEDDDGHDEPDECEPHEPRQHEEHDEERERRERDHAGDDGERPASPVEASPTHDRDGADERRGQDDPADRRQQQKLFCAARCADEHPEDGRADTERERGPEVTPVEANRLGDELADSPLIGRQRRGGSFPAVRHAG